MLKQYISDNNIFSSVNHVSVIFIGDIFRVSINPTDASERCNLRGLFDLLVGTQNMTLADHTTGEYLYTWPYSYLRRSGGNNMTFMFEAGRKCYSGDGVFKFRLSTAKVRETIEHNNNYIDMWLQLLSNDC